MSAEEAETSSTDGQQDTIEPKPKPKLVRVLTVVAYTLSVSMAAILLSIYYVFMWDGHPTLALKQHPPAPSLMGPSVVMHPRSDFQGCASCIPTSTVNRIKTENVLVDVAYEPTPIPVVEASKDSPITPLPTTDFAASFESGTSDETPAVFESPPESDHRKISTNLSKRSLFLKKLLSRNLLE